MPAKQLAAEVAEERKSTGSSPNHVGIIKILTIRGTWVGAARRQHLNPLDTGPGIGHRRESPTVLLRDLRCPFAGRLGEFLSLRLVLLCILRSARLKRPG
jgi:hypothetical protein